MNTRNQLICIWSGPISSGLFSVAMMFAGLTSPIAPSATAAEVVLYYQQHLEGVRIAAIIALFSAALLLMFTAALSAQLQRIERGFTPMAFLQLIGGLIGIVPFVLMSLFWTVITYRLGRSAELTQTLNDLVWFSILLPGPTVSMQFLAIGLGVLGDKSPTPSLPRWIGYYNIFGFLAALPGVVCGMVMTGMFAWNGLITYWLPGMNFTLWTWIMCGAMLWAQRKDAAKA